MQKTLLRRAALFASIFVLVSLSYSGAATADFVFSGRFATNTSNPGHKVMVGERISVAQLKARFKGYKVVSTAGEDCSFCATITGPAGSIEVHFDETGTQVTTILSNDNRATDGMGHRVGGSLGEAVGQSATCDSGMFVSCKSDRISGLWYIVQDDERCNLEIPNSQGVTKILLCSKIQGFLIGNE